MANTAPQLGCRGASIKADPSECRKLIPLMEACCHEKANEAFILGRQRHGGEGSINGLSQQQCHPQHLEKEHA